MGIDFNGVVTDSDGDAKLKLDLDFNVLLAGASPLVAADLVVQGANRIVGGGWLRLYDDATDRQLVDGDGLPVVGRATAQGITMVGHTDLLTHGHSPGTDVVDRFSGFKGDFPGDCLS